MTKSDFDFEKQTLRINKTFHRRKGKDQITPPKTVKSNRVIVLPDFLCDEIKDYLKMFYSLEPDQRIFPFTKSYLIHMGFTALAIGERVGHETEKITNRYAHLFPTVQTDMANKLDLERLEKNEVIVYGKE